MKMLEAFFKIVKAWADTWAKIDPQAKAAAIVAKVRFLVFLILLGGLFYALCLNHISEGEVGLTGNILSLVSDKVKGGTNRLQTKGWHFTSPITGVSIVPTRVMEFYLESSARGVPSQKRTVRFRPDGYQEFLLVEGWRYYWLDNRFSFNPIGRKQTKGIEDVLKGYAFSPGNYPFLERIGSTNSPSN